MKVALVVPWRSTPDRQEAFDVAMGVVRSLYPFNFVIFSDTDHQPFNRPAARNGGVLLAKDAGADVVVVNDADSVSEIEGMTAAIEGASDGLMHFPFEEAWYIDWKGMQRVKQRASRSQIQGRIWDKCPSEGGVWVCKPETWFLAGGQEEALGNWGCDDRAFLAASRTLVGPPVKHDGILYCLPHARQTEAETFVKEEVELLIRYEDAYGDPIKMKELIDGRPYLRELAADSGIQGV